MLLTIGERIFSIWRLEYWWVAFNQYEEFNPKGRVHLFKGIYWKKY